MTFWNIGIYIHAKFLYGIPLKKTQKREKIFIQYFALAFLLLRFQYKIQGKFSNTNSRLAMLLFISVIL